MDGATKSPPVGIAGSAARRRRALRLCCLGLAWVLGCSRLLAQAPADPLELLQKLNDASLEASRVYVLRDARITRDRLNFYFNRGFIGFLPPVNGEITGAVFEGDGEILLIPPDAVEKRSLARFTKSPILEERFTSVYLRFTDQTAQELMAQARPPDPDEFEQPTGFAERWNPLLRRLNREYSARVLLDLLGDRSVPSLHAYFQGVNLGAFEAEVDERLPEAVRVGALGTNHGRTYADLWCSFRTPRSKARIESLLVGPAQVSSYRIDTRIQLDRSLEARAELDLESRSNTDRVLVFELSRLLKVTGVQDEAGQGLVVVQNPSLEDSDAAARGNDWVLVILPSPIPVGKKFRLKFSYQGNVITDEGNGVLYVGARGSWYPNRGLIPQATYDLTFQFPENLTLVATGDRVEETATAGWKRSRWVSRGVIPVAGFNLGAYESRSRRVGDVSVEVYAAREAEDVLERRHAATQPMDEFVLQRKPEGGVSVGVMPRSVARLEPAARLDPVAEVAANAVEHFAVLFGPFPFPRLAVAQAPGHFGQGWPGLVYLPTLSFLPREEQSRMGLERKSQGFPNELAVAHEIAHQWWGNAVGWLTYRDQWISEGFATYAAALHMASEKDGELEFRELMRSYKQDLLTKTDQGETVESGGSLWLGQRLTNSLDPDGYTTIAYKKGCWVIHMLRAMMADDAVGPNEKFFQMLRDFLAAYHGKYASTEDFASFAAKYMTPAMDLDGNHRLDWFFASWVYGTGIPTYRLEATTRREAPRKYIIQGTIEQSGVSPDFEMLVPIIVEASKDKKVMLGRVAVGASGGHFHFTTTSKPARVAIDEDSILAVVR